MEEEFLGEFGGEKKGGDGYVSGFIFLEAPGAK